MSNNAFQVTEIICKRETHVICKQNSVGILIVADRVNITAITPGYTTKVQSKLNNGLQS